MGYLKYICIEFEDGKNAVITFPPSIDHDAMAEATNRMRFQTTGDWCRQDSEIVGAGFVTKDGECFGKSMTLGISSRELDTEILSNQYKS